MSTPFPTHLYQQTIRALRAAAPPPPRPLRRAA